jgi:hypothetical protein
MNAVQKYVCNDVKLLTIKYVFNYKKIIVLIKNLINKSTLVEDKKIYNFNHFIKLAYLAWHTCETICYNIEKYQNENEDTVQKQIQYIQEETKLLQLILLNRNDKACFNCLEQENTLFDNFLDDITFYVRSAYFNK